MARIGRLALPYYLCCREVAFCPHSHSLYTAAPEALADDGVGLELGGAGGAVRGRSGVEAGQISATNPDADFRP
jgi:hypothetical protein